MPEFSSSTKLSELAKEYQQAFEACSVMPNYKAEALSVARQIIKNKQRYLVIEKETGVPWFFVGLIAYRESTQDFTTHLHNGDSLNRRTVNEPKGRPLDPPKFGPSYTWQESAADAMRIKSFDMIKRWDIPTMLYSFELYNGFGYRTGMGRFTTPMRCSPYLWSGSTAYKKGKYTSDGSFNPWKVDAQLGCVPALKGLMELDPEVKSFFTVSLD